MLIVINNSKMKNVKKKTGIWPHGKEEMVVVTTRKCTLSREVITNWEEPYKIKVGFKIKMYGLNSMTWSGPPKPVTSTTVT